MHRYGRITGLIVAINIAGCTGVKLEPKVKNFGDTTAAQIAATRILLDKKASEPDYIERRRLALAQEEDAAFDTAGDKCRYLDVAAADLDAKSLYLKDRCSIEPFVFGATPEERLPFPYGKYATDEDNAVRGGQRIAKALEGYAEGLANLADAKDDGTLVENYEKAAASITDVAREVALLRDGEAINPATLALAKKGNTLFAGYLGDALAAARYTAMKRLVVGSDETVTKAVRILASGVSVFEDGTLETADDAFQSAASDLRKEIRAPDATPETIAEKIAALEEAKAAYDAADEGRLSLATLSIARTHRAMARSFSNGEDVVAYTAAQDRIRELIVETDSFVKAVEDLADDKREAGNGNG